jgi:hypothetical protein
MEYFFWFLWHQSTSAQPRLLIWSRWDFILELIPNIDGPQYAFCPLVLHFKLWKLLVVHWHLHAPEIYRRVEKNVFLNPSRVSSKVLRSNIVSIYSWKFFTFSQYFPFFHALALAHRALRSTLQRFVNIHWFHPPYHPSTGLLLLADIWSTIRFQFTKNHLSRLSSVSKRPFAVIHLAWNRRCEQLLCIGRFSLDTKKV